MEPCGTPVARGQTESKGSAAGRCATRVAAASCGTANSAYRGSAGNLRPRGLERDAVRPSGALEEDNGVN